jgi:hypothetical protein
MKAQFRKALIEAVEKWGGAVSFAAGKTADADVWGKFLQVRAEVTLGTVEPVPTFSEAGGGEAVEEFARVDAYARKGLAEAVGGVEGDSQVLRVSGGRRKVGW